MNKSLQFLKSQIGKETTNSPSPLMQWLKPVILAVEEGTIEFEYEVRPEWLNPIGTLHGGIIAAIVDDAIGATVFTYGEPVFYSTINNAIDYFSIAKEGQKIIALTTVTKKGRQLINAQCEIWNSERSRILAKGYSNLLKTTVQK
jgi:acyl-coenzyme A thioesterase 13